MKLAITICLFGIAILSLNATDRQPSLKEAYKDHFLIGTILAGGHSGVDSFRQSEAEKALISREFNALTAENCMKPKYVQPEEAIFDFGPADYVLKFAGAHEMKMIGHTLIWHQQSPDWLFLDDSGKLASRETMLGRMRDHIHTYVGRYKGRVQYWDVVNEAVVPKKGSKEATYRDSLWFQTVGEDYLEQAFRFAHEADPEAKLYYNDYGMTGRAKVDFVIDMVTRMRAKGVPIHGVGVQGHWGMDWPSLDAIEYAIRSFAEAGIPISITELDITVLPSAYGHSGANISDLVDFSEQLNPYADSIPDEVLEAQSERYRELFELFIKYSDSIERVSFWGTHDSESWKNNYPIRGRTDYPLLFDRKLQPKPAYHALIDLANGS